MDSSPPDFRLSQPGQAYGYPYHDATETYANNFSYHVTDHDYQTLRHQNNHRQSNSAAVVNRHPNRSLSDQIQISRSGFPCMTSPTITSSSSLVPEHSSNHTSGVSLRHQPRTPAQTTSSVSPPVQLSWKVSAPWTETYSNKPMTSGHMSTTSSKKGSNSIMTLSRLASKQQQRQQKPHEQHNHQTHLPRATFVDSPPPIRDTATNISSIPRTTQRLPDTFLSYPHSSSSSSTSPSSKSSYSSSTSSSPPPRAPLHLAPSVNRDTRVAEIRRHLKCLNWAVTTAPTCTPMVSDSPEEDSDGGSESDSSNATEEPSWGWPPSPPLLTSHKPSTRRSSLSSVSTNDCYDDHFDVSTSSYTLNTSLSESSNSDSGICLSTTSSNIATPAATGVTPISTPLPVRSSHVTGRQGGCRRRKPVQPQRSAQRNDPKFKGVTFQIRTKLTSYDSHLSISAYYNCRKLGRLKSRWRQHASAVSNMESDFGHKKIRTQDRLLSRDTHTRFIRDNHVGTRFLLPHRQASARNARTRRPTSLTWATTGKQCASCGTRKTPLWRDAEDGTPLCNACGIRYKKYRIRCSHCWHIPKKETKGNRYCTNCGEMLKLSIFRCKPWI